MMILRLVTLLNIAFACRAKGTRVRTDAVDSGHASAPSRHRRLLATHTNYKAHDAKNNAILYDYLKGKRAVFIGPADDASDHSDIIHAGDVIVRVNTKVVNGSVWISSDSINLTTNRTDIVCHHSVQSSEMGLYGKNWRPETSMSSSALAALDSAGVKFVICVEPWRCDAAIALKNPQSHVNVVRLDSKSLAYVHRRNLRKL